MPRYVILCHDPPGDYARPRHWDLMLEIEGRLRTWALQDQPRANGIMSGESLADHRIDYLDYEGPVSGGRGHVRRWDRGEYRFLHCDQDRWVLEMKGDQFNGTMSAVRTSDQSSMWQF